MSTSSARTVAGSAPGWSVTNACQVVTSWVRASGASSESMVAWATVTSSLVPLVV